MPTLKVTTVETVDVKDDGGAIYIAALINEAGTQYTDDGGLERLGGVTTEVTAEVSK